MTDLDGVLAARLLLRDRPMQSENTFLGSHPAGSNGIALGPQDVESGIQIRMLWQGLMSCVVKDDSTEVSGFARLINRLVAAEVRHVPMRATENAGCHTGFHAVRGPIFITIDGHAQ